MNNEPMNSSTPPEAPRPPQGEKFCPRCGKKLPATATFCGDCGTSLTGNATAPMVVVQNTVPAMDTSPMKTGDFFLLLLLSAIPVVGFILLLVWAFSSSGNVNRRNFCRAQLIMTLIGAVLSVIYVVLYFIFIFALVESGSIPGIDPGMFGMIFFR